MNVEAVLEMKAGLGETSYEQNSSIQKKSMNNVKSLATESATQVYMSLRPDMFTVADLGCASGTNALSLVEDIIRSIANACRRGSPPPEFSVLLNDLPTNDFNAVFSHLPQFTAKLQAHDPLPTVFVSGVPGSFYGRLFPSRSLHLVCCLASLHWLSQVPPGLRDETNTPINKGKMFISNTSPAAVATIYRRQFQRDFSLFLRSRATEVVPGGRMVLAMQGRHNECLTDGKTTLLFDLLSESLATLVTQGQVEQEKVDAYNVPFYAPSIREMEEEVQREGSFRVDYVQTCEINLSSSGDAKEDGRTLSMAVRAVQESMLSHHFGADIIDRLFHEYTGLVTDYMEREEIRYVQVGVGLVRS
ncbi:hypothetical protein ACP4OV_029660 [Aristida adscensionis]